MDELFSDVSDASHDRAVLRRARTRDTSTLAVGSAVSGLLAYVFFSAVTRALGAEDAAPVSVLWTYWAASSAVLTFPLQHWIARSVEVHRGEHAVRGAIGGVAVVIGLAAAATGLVAWVGRGALFHRGDVVFPALVAVVTLGSGFVGVVRGTLTARRRFTAVGLALVGENTVRCVAAAALIVVGIRVSGAYGAALAIGPLIGLAWPSAVRFGSSDATRRGEVDTPLAFLGGVAGGSLLGQFILTGGPVVLALAGGAPSDVTALFAGLALFRAPYTIGLGVVAQVTGWLTRLVTEERGAELRRLRLLLVVVTGLTAAGAALIGVTLGPAAVRGVFGPDVILGAGATGLIAVGSTFAMANLVLTLALIAWGNGGDVLRAWIVGLVAGAVGLAAAPLAPVGRVVVAFVAAELAAFAAMLVMERRATGALEQRA